MRKYLLLLAVCTAPALFAAASAKMFNVNGIDVILRQSKANQVIAANLFIKGGTVATPNEVTIAIEGMALGITSESGPADMTKDAFQRKMEGMVSSIGGSASKDYSTMSMRCVKLHFGETWDLFARTVLNAGFDEAEIMKAKQGAITAIKSIKSNPDAYVGYLVDSLYFAGHPYSRRPTIPEVEGLTVDAMRAHLKSIMVKKRLLLVLVGDVDESDVRAKVESSLAKLPEGTFTDPVLGVPAKAASPGSVIVDKKLPTMYLMGFFDSPTRNAPDYWASIVMGITLNNRLFEEVRTKRNLSYAPSAGANPGKTSHGMLYVTTTLPDSAVKVMLMCVDKLQNELMDPADLKSQVAQFITSVYLRDETMASQCEALGRYQIYTGNWENSLHVVEKVQALTPQDIQNVAKKYIRNINWAAVGKSEKVTKALLESR
jgi:zinc protease